MEEDEEIDIIGHFEGFGSRNEQDLSKISSGQILSCDYTVHPSWINENAEGGNYWTDSVPKNENLESNVQILHSEEVVIEELEPVRTITDAEWAAEAQLHEDLIFEEDIPASIEEIVTNQEEEFLTTSDDVTDSDHFSLEAVAFETHPPPKNHKLIGPTHSRSLLKVKMELPESTVIATSATYSGGAKKRPPVESVESKFKKTLTVPRNYKKSNKTSQQPSAKLATGTTTTARMSAPTKMSMKPPKKPVAKFKQTVNMRSHDLENGKFAALRKKIKKYKENYRGGGGKRSRKATYTTSREENITISHELELVGKVASPVDPGVVLKLEKCDSDVEVDIDIESDASTENQKISKNSATAENHIKPETASQPESSSQDDSEQSDEASNSNIPDSILNRYTGLSEPLISQLQSRDLPKVEHRINPIEISDLEKFVHSDFFENRTTKTPEQYLRIRNHILNMWHVSKPNYVSKTAVRTGLKHGGDVNCISRIHRLLEQIGAINFGCDGKYFEYVRPLETFISLFVQTPRNRSNSSNSSVVPLFKERRQRARLNTFTSNIDELDDGANYTIVHMDGIIRPVPEPRSAVDSKPRPRIRHIKSELDLVKCLRFPDEFSEPFKMSLTLSTALCLQLHALSSTNEVMGFLGGHCDGTTIKKRIKITRYKPCLTTTQSRTTCEMCPVSQVEQFSNLRAEGYDLLGWFHSHPQFLPNPSHTDIRTQKEMQSHFVFDDNRPFVGIIFSCLSMSFKCIYMMPDISSISKDENNTPYEIQIDITKDCDSFREDVKDVFNIIRDEIEDMTGLLIRFKASSETILKQFGHNSEAFFKDIIL